MSSLAPPNRDPLARKDVRPIGLAIVGGGRVGAFRGSVAARSPQVGWIGVAEVKPDRIEEVSQLIGADFSTSDYVELLDRSEVDAVVICTDEALHVEPILAAAERGLPMLIEKPLALDLADSARVLGAIEEAGVDAVMGYTQRFRQRFMTAKDRLSHGAIGDLTLLSARGLLNRMVSQNMYEARRPEAGIDITPMAMAGTHMVDLAMWLLEGSRPANVFSRSADHVYGPRYGGVDQTLSIVEFDDGALANIAFNWAMPTSWPCSVYSLDLAMVGTEGALTIDDTHRDVVLAVTEPQLEGYAPDSSRVVDFLGSYLPGDVALGELRGPMREETVSWLNRVTLGTPTHHAPAADGHERLMMTCAMDLSARLGRSVELPLDIEEFASVMAASGSESRS